MNTSRPRRPDVTDLEIIGGAEPLTVGLHEYDERWPGIYLEHRRRILDALAGVGVDVDVEHIGSTSVPGLAAKPVVDIVVAVDDITAEEDYLDALLAAVYDYLLLRDRLRTDAGDRAIYESTKRDLFRRQWADMNAYSDAKTEVILAITARARAAREG